MPIEILLILSVIGIALRLLCVAKNLCLLQEEIRLLAIVQVRARKEQPIMIVALVQNNLIRKGQVLQERVFLIIKCLLTI
jgi:hypothetical protein